MTEPPSTLWRLDPEAQAAFRTADVSDVDVVLDIGVLSPAFAARFGVSQRQQLEPSAALMEKKLPLPGRPAAADVVHARHAFRTPLADRREKARYHALVQNRDLVLAVTLPDALNRFWIPYCNLSARSRRMAQYSDSIRGWAHYLWSLAGVFAGRGPIFDSGLLIPTRLPPKAIVALVCAAASRCRRARAFHVVAAADPRLTDC